MPARTSAGNTSDMASPGSRPRLGELLVRAGVVSPEQADAAAGVPPANQRTTGQQLGVRRGGARLAGRGGVVSPEQAAAAAAVPRANERTIGQQLVVDGAVTELELAAALSYQLDVPLALFGSLAVDEVAVHLTPPDLARTHKLLVVGARDGEI